MASLLPILSLIVCAAISGAFSAPGQRSYVVNGEDAEEDEFPWQLSVQLSGLHICAGVLIERNRALTAGHCTLELDALNGSAPVTVVAGMTRMQTQDPAEYQIVEVEGFLRHPEYNEGDGNTPNDISILYLEEEVELNDHVRTIPLPDQGEDFLDATCWFSGWGGEIGDGEGRLADNLQKTSIPVITNQQCQDILPDTQMYQDAIVDTHICIYDGISTPCNGDSGGPVSCQHNEEEGPRLAGINSWGVVEQGQGCAVEYPSSNTRVSEFTTWIRENI